MATAGLGLLDHRDRHLAETLGQRLVVGQPLQQPVGARQTGGAAADDRDPDVDPLVLAIESTLDELLDDIDGRRKVDRRRCPVI